MPVISEVKLVDATGTALGTAQNPVVSSATSIVTSSSTDPGQDLSLEDTNSHQFGSAAATIGVMVSCPIANTKPVYVAFATGVTTSTGVELNPGDREFFPVSNANKLWAITGTATQHAHALAI